MSTRIKLAFALIGIFLAIFLIYIVPYWSFSNVTTTTNVTSAGVEIARSKQAETIIYPQHNNDDNQYLIQTTHHKLFGLSKTIYEHTFVNNTTDALSYNSNIVDGTKPTNNFIAAINDRAIKQITYTDHVGAQGVIGLINADGTLLMSSTHDIAQYPQLIYVNGGFKKGTLTAIDEQGNVIYEEEINLD